MASRLLKHIGFKGKKAPPHPPKPDYGGQKSASMDLPSFRSPTCDRISITSSPQFGEFDVSSVGSHRSSVSLDKTSPKCKEASGSLSPKGDRCSSLASGLEDGEHTGNGDSDRIEGASAPAASATPPRLLDEYSDPADLKQQITDLDMLGACAPVPVQEDDYSVPYEVKKLFKEMRLREGDGARVPRHYDDPFEDGPSTSKGYPESQDLRPPQDYDEPWEWAAKSRLLLESSSLPPSSLPMATSNSTTTITTTASVPQLPSQQQTTHTSPPLPAATASTDSQRISDSNSKLDNGQPLCNSSTNNGHSILEEEGVAAGENNVHSTEESYDYEKAQRTATESDDEGYTHLREEFGPSGPLPPPPSASGTNDTAPASVAVPTTSAAATAGSSDGSAVGNKLGNYEEPWDLPSKQLELEEKLRLASESYQRASMDLQAKSNIAPPHESDSRTLEGYEKPWDWKPHQKDDRDLEGYEKPWDWKPHQKDERPGEEYDQPWDQKVKDIERDILKAKNAKDGGVKEADTRPPEEYDEPWDSKAKKAVSRTGSSSDNSSKSGQSPVLTSSGSPSATTSGQAQQSSPKKKQKLNLDLGCRGLNTVGERIDPKKPLDQQGWYHGSISRVDAENLLRVHKEGSYLVRMSESSKQDYSLSLKSARGFMHMKIVTRDNKFILGQFSQPFDTIPLMIHHYSISKLPIKGAEHMSLLHPVMHELL